MVAEAEEAAEVNNRSDTMDSGGGGGGRYL